MHDKSNPILKSQPTAIPDAERLDAVLDEMHGQGPFRSKRVTGPAHSPPTRRKGLTALKSATGFAWFVAT